MQPVDEAVKLEARVRPETSRGVMRAGYTEIHIRGKSVSVPSVKIDDRTVITTGRWLKTAAVQDEDLVEGETVVEPSSFVCRLEKTQLKADLFTFAQKLPETTPKYDYHVEWDNVAVIPITTFSDWWEKRVDPGVRRAVRKAAKNGVVIKLQDLDDAFVKGIVGVNNETPMRQGRAFWHFQKSFEAVQAENSTYGERNTFLGAYYQNDFIGFIRITYTDHVANIVQLLTMTKHYDKRPANALIAKAVEHCEQKGISHLMYYSYIYNDPNSSLTEFKRRNGFEKVLLPRYYIPLTLKGRGALKLGLHRELAQNLPKPLLIELLKMRSLWYARRLKAIEGTL
jgi:Acetyltransferase (GNAT) family